MLGFLENLDRLLGVRLHRPDIVLIITSAAVGPAGVRTVMIVRFTMIMMIMIADIYISISMGTFEHREYKSRGEDGNK